jgi:hypothetical protein
MERMATLNSPGVSVNIINESFYTPAAPGTVPLVIVATGANKANASSTGTAPGTTSAYKSRVWTITSQRDLTDTFGTPKFYRDVNNNPVHGGELNEYGLQAAYSLLGVSSKAYVVRADIDLTQLVPQASVPNGPPASSSYWFDTSNTKFGIFEWNKATGVFTNKVPTIIDDSNASLYTTNGDGITLKSSFGAVGSYVITTDKGNRNLTSYKNSDGTWVSVGSSGETAFASNANVSTFVSTTWQTSWPAVKGTTTSPSFLTAAGNLTINSNNIAVTTASTVATIAQSINSTLRTSGIGAKVNSQNQLELYVDATPGQITLTGTASTLAAAGLVASTYAGPALTLAPHTQYPDYSVKPSGSVYVKTTSPNDGASWTLKQYSATAQAFNQVAAPIYATAEDAIYGIDKTGGTKIAVGTLFVEANFNHGNGTATTSSNYSKFVDFRIQRRAAVSPTTITSEVKTVAPVLPNGAVLTIKESLANQYLLDNEKSITLNGTTIEALVTQINAAGFTNVSASVNGDRTISINHRLGGEIKFGDNSGILNAAGFTAYAYNSGTDTWAGSENYYAAGSKEVDGYDFKASNWEPLVYTASSSAPSTSPEDGQLWYSSVIDEVDIMYHNGTTWKGYKNAFPTSNPTGPILAASEPTTQTDGTALVNGDIWIRTSNISEYGQYIYIFNGVTLRWEEQDVADQTSPNGWVFADARWSGAGDDVNADSIQTLLSYDYVDPDAPNPALYPRGTRLWNLRRSGFNVKKYVMNHIDIYSNNGTNARYNDEPMDGSNETTPYNPDRWVTVSPNQENGAGSFGPHAQRSFVVASLKAEIDTNQQIRDTDTLIYNLIACPGYPEVIQNMIGLNTDRAQTAFVIGDTPFRLPATGTDLAAWGSNSNKALDNNEKGGVSYDEYMAMFYPSGYTNDNLGNYIVVPPSHMMLRTFITSDQKSYQWFAPAGSRRGGVDNATAVGYISTEGEFTQAALPQGLRDVLAGVKVNPIATLNGAGILNFGNYSRARASSSLDRINVARLVAFLRRQLDVLVRPFLFEPNDQLTRNEAKNAVDSFLLELVGQRALYDYIVVCDESNNTPTRIDRSELWIDIAVEPVKAVEFIYIPVRLLNTGAIKSGNFGLQTNG